MKLIPKILHTYWDKNTPMSWLQALTITSFRKYNPSWDINVYVPKQNYAGSARYIPNYTGKDYFPVVEGRKDINLIEVDLTSYDIDLQHHNILRSDILRYNLLYNHGGVWSDFDVLWLKPMEYFYQIEYYGNVVPDEITAVVSLMKGTYSSHSIGIMIHSKEDPYAKELIEMTKQVKPPFGHETFGSLMISKRYNTLKSMSHFKGLIGVKHETYYPYDIHPPNPTFNKLYLENDLSLLTKDVLCLHWYNGKELSKHYVNRFDINRHCSMSTILRQEGYVK